MGKRIFLFMGVNILVVVTLSIILSLLGVGSYITQYGLNYESLAIFCLIWGMGGAFISLFISKWIAKKFMGVQIIDPKQHQNEPQLMELIQTVHNLARSAGLTTMPEVGVYVSPEVNAFATGRSRSNSLVAVSSGLLERMDRDELEGVLGHEIAHIANGDMVTMALLQGVVNAFVMFLARIIAFAVMRGDDDEEGSVGGIGYFFVVIGLEMVLMFFAYMVVAKFSRYREFHADAGGAKLAGNENMIKALTKLQSTVELADMTKKPSFQSMKISSRRKGFLMALRSSHPPLEQRIARLQSFRG